jgi:hypothetical protein
MKKNSPKIIPDQRPLPKADETDDSELPEIPTFSAFFPNKILIDRDCEAKAFELCELQELAQVIRQYSQSTVNHVGETLSHAGLAILNAWTCGSALNAAKKKSKHGTFESWFHREFLNSKSIDHQFSFRTAQRYMRIASKYPTAAEVIGSSASLRQAYQACGILPAPPEDEKPADKDRDAAARVSLLKGVVSVRDRLLKFSEKKIPLDEDTRKELVDTKSEIDRLFASLME